MSFFDQKEPDFSLHVFGEETLVDFENKRWSVPTRRIHQLMGIHQDQPITLIPPCVVASGFHQGKNVQFYHQQPKVYPINLCMPQPHNFDFSWPDLLFRLVRDPDGVYADNLRVFTFQGTLCPETILYIPSLPNLGKSGGMCFGNISQKVTDPAVFLDRVFFKSTFTHLSCAFPKIEAPIDQYLFQHRQTGWHFEDLPIFGSFAQAMEVMDAV